MTHDTMIPDTFSVFTAKPTVMSVGTPIRFFPDEENDVRLRCQHLFGRMLSLAELVALCGGYDGNTELTVGIANSGLYLEYRHSTSDCVGSCLIFRTEDLRLVLINEHVRFLRRNAIERKKYTQAV